MVNPVHLRTFMTVVRTGSFADAARVLGYTSSAVSQQIAALERAVRLPLFEREARSVKATPIAELLAASAQTALSAFDVFASDVQALTDGRLGRVRVGSFPSASRGLLPDAMADFHGSFPEVGINLDEGEPDELISLLLANEVDMSLVYRYDLVPSRWPRSLGVVELLEEDLVLLLPEGHRLAESEDGRVELAELRDLPWISARQGTAGARCMERLCAMRDFEPRVTIRSNDYDVVRGFVRARLGVALVPALSHVESPGVTAMRLDVPEVRRHVALLQHPRPTASQAALGEALTKAAQSMVRQHEFVRTPSAS